MGFLIRASHEEVDDGKFQAALKMHPSYSDRVISLLVDVEDKFYKIACVKEERDYLFDVWVEKEKGCSDNSFIFIQGWCYRIDSFEETLTDRDYREMLDRYRKGFLPIDENFSGNYVAVVYDAKSKKIVVQPDRWAMQSVYFSISEREIIVSDRAIVVASLASAAFDGYSVLSLMRGTHMPFGRSLFSGVSRVMCGCYIEINVHTGHFGVKRAFSIYVPIQEITFKESGDAIANIMHAMGSRLTKCKSAIFDLTGGNDTRLTAAAIASQNPDGLNNNFAWRVAGPEDHPDVQIAQKIAQIRNWKLLRLSKNSLTDASREELQKSVVYADGTCLVDAAFGRIKQENSYQDQWDWLVGSIGGEILRGFFWRHEMLSLGRTNKVNYAALLAYRIYASRGVNSKLLGEKAPSLNEHDEVLLEPYKQIGRIGGELLNPYKLDAMYMHKLCYNAGNPQSWVSRLKPIRLPILSWEITRLTLSLPWRLRFSRRLVLKVIEDLDPLLASVPNDKGEPMRPLGCFTLSSYLKNFLLMGVKTTPRIIQRYTGSFGSEQKLTSNPPPASWLSIVEEIKHLSTVLDPLLIKQAVEDVLSSSRNSNKLKTFYTLLTLELLFHEVPNLRREVVFEIGQKIK